MIHQIFAAPKQLPVKTGIAFAEKFQLGYEIPGFVEPAALDDAAVAIAQWQVDLSGLQGMLSLHGPVYDLNPVSWDPSIAEVSLRRYRQAVEACQALGCRYLVVHSQYNPIFAAANVQQAWLAASIDFWRQFAEDVLAPAENLVVVIENFMEPTPELLRRLVEGVQHPQIKACLDTGHANLFSQVPLTAWLDELESSLVYLHAHNNFGVWDEHRGFDKGTLDLEGFLNHLMLTPYKIHVALEIFNEPELLESMALLQHYYNLQQQHIPEKTFLI